MRFGFAAVIPVVAIILFCQPATTSAAADRSISGSVFFDTNKNGQFDFGEAPAPGRTVELSRFDRASHFVAKTKSNADGYYHFDHIPSYFAFINVGVRTDAQTGCLTGVLQGGDNENGGMLRGKTVPPGSKVDLGVLPMGDGEVTGTFTSDLNENGVHDAGEPPLKGWKLTVQGIEPPNVYCHSEATTASDGAFLLAVNANRYNWLGVYPPSSVKGPWEWTAPTQRSGLAGSAPDQQERSNFVGKGDHLDVMIHFSTGNATLSGTVFEDLDKDATHDPMEPLLDCHHVKHLLQLSRRVPGVGAIEIYTEPSCVNAGDFTFNELEGGDYRLAVPGSFQTSSEHYGPSFGDWWTVRDGQHPRDFTVALTPIEYPQHSSAPKPTPSASVPLATGGHPLIMPPAGSQTDESNYVSAALLLATMGFASIFAAVLLHAYRARRN